MSYHVRLDFYEGPLALLVHLIESQELDIWNIPIAEITDQYLGYLAAMEELNLEIGGEFLVMAATLLAIKAQMLLPQEQSLDLDDGWEEEHYDPREELVQRLLEYRQFREAARNLAEHLAARGVVACRGTPPPPGSVRYTNPVGKATVQDLATALTRLLDDSSGPKPLPLPRYTVTLEERVEQVLRLFKRKKRVSFASLCKRGDRRFTVVTFLAILELIRKGAASATQPEIFGPITIERVEDGMLP